MGRCRTCTFGDAGGEFGDGVLGYLAAAARSADHEGIRRAGELPGRTRRVASDREPAGRLSRWRLHQSGEPVLAARAGVIALLGSPVSLSSDGSALSFELAGASGTASVSGDDASFADALPATDVRYESEAGGVSEAVTLKDSSAPTVLRFDLSASSGLSAHQLADGTVQLVDHGGAVRFSIPPAVAYRSRARTYTDIQSNY